jgi:peptide subunit release factor RF-3
VKFLFLLPYWLSIIKKINILETPSHKDFAEDTFKTLTTVNSDIVVVDVTKGVEEQTEKLLEVCRMRSISMIVFINIYFVFSNSSTINFLNLVGLKLSFISSVIAQKFRNF